MDGLISTSSSTSSTFIATPSAADAPGSIAADAPVTGGGQTRFAGSGAKGPTGANAGADDVASVKKEAEEGGTEGGMEG